MQDDPATPGAHTATITLPRFNDRPLRFTGRVLAGHSTQRDSGPAETRWWLLSLYETQAGQFVLALAYRTRWQGEDGVDLAWHARDAGELMQRLQAQDPLQFATGLLAVQQRRDPASPDPRFAALRQAWGIAVAGLLANFPEQLP